MDGPNSNMVSPSSSGTSESVLVRLIALEVCLAIQSTFFGLVVGVAISYYGKNKDGWKLRLFVSLQLALNLVILAVSWRQFTGLSTGPSFFSAPNQPGGSHMAGMPMSESAFRLLMVPLILAGVNIMLSQFFLAYHVFRLDYRWFGVLCATLITIFAALGFALSVWLITEVTSSSRSSISTTALHVSQELCIVIADLIVTFFLFQHFWKMKRCLFGDQNAQIHNRSSHLMNKIMIMIANRGVLVTCFQLAFFAPSTVGMDSISKDSAGFIPWIQLNGSLANVYVFTTLIILTTRDSMRDTLSKPLDIEETNTRGVIAIQPWKPEAVVNIAGGSSVQSDSDAEPEVHGTSSSHE